MESLMLSLRVIFPICFMVALGYVAQRGRLAPREVFDGCSTLVFHLVFPIYLFYSVSNTDLSQAFDPALMLVGVGGVVACWAASMVLIPHVERSDPKRGAMIQGIFRGNLLLFGIPVAETIAGPEAVGAAAMIVAVVVPIYNTLAVVTLETFRGGRASGKKLVKSIATNPLVLSCLLGLLWQLLGLELPELLAETLGDISAIATPLALIALGGTFRFSALRDNAKPLAIVLAAKLVIMPALIMGIGLALGMRGAALAVLLAVSGTPTATSSFPMAQKMGSDGELAGQIVVTSAFLSLFTMFFWVYLLSSLGLV